MSHETKHAEAWVRQNYRMQPDEEALVHVLAEYLCIRNEPLPTMSWYTPGPSERKQWKAQVREFVEECRYHGISEENMPRCLRSVIERYRREWKGQNPRSLRSLIPYIGEYETEDQERQKYVTGQYSDFIER